MQKITPFLWFDGRIEEAIQFYTGIFKPSTILEKMPGPGNRLQSAILELNGQQLMLFDGGPHFKFTEAISLFISCSTQDEIDELWEKLSAGGQQSRCGWLKDKFGLSWQVVPSNLQALLYEADPKKSAKVMQAMLQMNKLVIADLLNAAEE
jgi:predicted 3-demethylubiquinone-9 3-methyltransferase (glyoxalase superfamily)